MYMGGEEPLKVGAILVMFVEEEFECFILSYDCLL
jgi:hypothetical protein